LIVVHLEAGALRDAEAIAGMLARTDIPERLSGEHRDRYQALAVRQQILTLFALIQRKEVSKALAVARAALGVLEEVEKAKTKA
jgi:hypothetical protein